MASKNKQKLKVCQYGENCYRKNPIHFGEYSHPHLDQIYEIGRDPETNEYSIPDDLILSSEVIGIQLTLLEKLFPKEEKSKKPKPVNDVKPKVPEAKTEPAASTSKAAYQAQNSRGGGYRLDGNNINTNQTQQKSEKESTGFSEKRSHAVSPLETAVNENDSSSNLAKKQKITKNIRDYIPVVVEKGKMAEKLEKAAPYNFFLTTITDCKPTHNEPLSVTLQEILDESLGEIESSCQINFMVDIGWLLGHYYFAGLLGTPLLVLYGDDMPELRTISQYQPHVTAIRVNMPTPFATSHTKMMLFSYKDGSIRVVVSTANLYEDDWHNRTQGVWISPKLPPLPETADTLAGESPTNFKHDLMAYLVEYKIPKLQTWIAKIRKSDCGAVNVFFIGSVPGGFREGLHGHPWGHARLGHILQKHCTAIPEPIPVVCQSSSIGSLGANVQAWIQHDFVNSLRKDSQGFGVRQFPPFKMIYPSMGNVLSSHDGILGGGCLPYSKNTNDKQPWLKTHLHQWSARTRHRSNAMPHIKSYTRFNLDERCVYWFMLTSANLSKAAWGAFNKNVKLQPCLRIFNYEGGVLFLPRFVIGEETFPLDAARDGIPPFPMPYDVPLVPYGPDDAPFLMDYLH